MLSGLKTPQLPLLVFTDLDGTLLDHDDYSFTAAAPALARLGELNIPLIPNTSKTLAEMEVLSRSLQSPHPCIVENGSALCIPEGYFGHLPGASLEQGYQVLRLAPTHDELLATLHRLRVEHGYQFRGFSDMTAFEVAEDTGLSTLDAARARKRLCTEPLLWQDSEEALENFRADLMALGLSLTRGGRYWHVMTRQNKARAMQRLQAIYEANTGRTYTVVALGDSPNDAEMLRMADIAVVVRRPDGSYLHSEGAARTLHTAAIGPAGWNGCVQQIIDELEFKQQQDSA